MLQLEETCHVEKYYKIIKWQILTWLNNAFISMNICVCMYTYLNVFWSGVQIWQLGRICTNQAVHIFAYNISHILKHSSMTAATSYIGIVLFVYASTWQMSLIRVTYMALSDIYRIFFIPTGVPCGNFFYSSWTNWPQMCRISIHEFWFSYTSHINVWKILRFDRICFRCINLVYMAAKWLIGLMC